MPVTPETVTMAGQILTKINPIQRKIFGGSKPKKTPAEEYANMSYQDRRKRDTETAADYYRNITSGAKAGGFHPLAALGMPPAASIINQANARSLDTGDIKGQNIGRAIGALVPNAKKTQLEALALERAGLENDLLRSQITNINNQAGDPPAVAKLSHEQVMARPDDSGKAAGLPPAMVEYDLGKGWKIELPYSQEGPAEALESLPVGLKHGKAVELFSKREAAKRGIPSTQDWKKLKFPNPLPKKYRGKRYGKIKTKGGSW